MTTGYVQNIGSNSLYSAKDIQAYIDKRLSETPQTEKGGIHRVEKGENLWTIAAKYLGKSKPTNAEIQDFMYKIAKLNNKETIEDFNTLDINDTLYIPEVSANESAAAKNKATPSNSRKNHAEAKQEPKLSNAEKLEKAIRQLNELTAPDSPYATYTQKTLTKYNKLQTVPTEVFEAHGHAGFNYWTEQFKNNKNLITEKSFSVNPLKPSAVVFRIMNNDGTRISLYASINNDGTLKNVAFDAPGFDVKNISFDYTVGKDGKIVMAAPSGFGKLEIGQISSEEYNAMVKAIEPRIKEALAKAY